LPKPGGRKMSIRKKDARVPQESVFKKVINRIRRISGFFYERDFLLGAFLAINLIFR